VAKVVIDTNLLTAIFRHQVSQLLKDIAANVSPLVTSVSLHELLRNPYYLDMARRHQIMKRINKLIASRSLSIINPTQRDWQNAALLILQDMKISPSVYSRDQNVRTSQLRRISFDALILSTAASAGAGVMTRNYREFSRLNNALAKSRVRVIDANGLF
jgi:predicted nucleic acid-binding protein